MSSGKNDSAVATHTFINVCAVYDQTPCIYYRQNCEVAKYLNFYQLLLFVDQIMTYLVSLIYFQFVYHFPYCFKIPLFPGNKFLKSTIIGRLISMRQLYMKLLIRIASFIELWLLYHVSLRQCAEGALREI